MTGTALLLDGLRQMGAARVIHHIPNSVTEGYGLSQDGLAQSLGAGASLIITVDCGTSEIAKSRWLEDQRCDLIVTDHHQPGDELPVAVAILNPHRKECKFPFKPLAGVGVAWYLLRGLAQRQATGGPFLADPAWGLDLVAIGAVADIVPLLGANRILVREGLKRLNENARPGLQTLKDALGLTIVESKDVGWKIAPVLNVAKRTGEGAEKILELLLATVGDGATTIAASLVAANKVRRVRQGDLVVLAKTLINNPEDGYLFAASPEFEPGMVGLVAGTLLRENKVPVLLVALNGDRSKISGRVPQGFDLSCFFRENCHDLVEAPGGHPQAAGAGIRQDQLGELRERLASWAQQTAPDTVPQSHDGEITLDEVNLEEANALSQLAPFGAGFDEPGFLLREVTVSSIKKTKWQVTFQVRDKNSGSMRCSWLFPDDKVAALQVGALLGLRVVPEQHARDGLGLKVQEVMTDGVEKGGLSVVQGFVTQPAERKRIRAL